MMNDNDSNMAANAVAHAALMVQHSIAASFSEYERPSAVFRPKIYPDGNMWCALYGDDLQSGVAGFGETPAAAMYDFDKNWRERKLPTPAKDCAVCGEDHKGAVPFACATGDGQ